MMHGSSIRGILLVGTLVLIAFIQSPTANAQSQPPQRALSLMPWPSSIQQGSGELHIEANFSVALTGHTEPRLDRSVARFLKQLNRETAFPNLAKSATTGKATLTIHTDHASKEIQELGEDESYTLEVTADGAKLNAATPLGAMHGLQTFLQLVEPGPNGFDVPVVKINDQPRFPWRGLMFDVGRHFIPLDVLRSAISMGWKR